MTDFSNKAVVAAYEKYPLIHREVGKPAFLDLVGDVRGLTVLDVGCGTGHMSESLRQRGAICTGVDSSPAFVEAARAQHGQNRFDLGDAGDLHMYFAGEFDVAILMMVVIGIHNRETLNKIFSECARVLKPGGHLVFSTSHPAMMRNFRDNIREVKMDDDNYFCSGKRYTVTIPLSDLTPITFTDTYWTLEDLSLALEQAGLAIVQLREPQLPETSAHFERLKDELTTPYYIMIRAKKG